VPRRGHQGERGASCWLLDLAGIAISACSVDVRAAQQIGMFASLPPLGIVALMSFNVITPTLGLARARRRAADRRCLDGGAVAMFDRERLVTGTRS
jgi:ABC-2 type transport system permease protein